MFVFLGSKNYSTFHNVIIPSSSGTSQIDHIIVSQFGVFIVETKNLRGWIFGSEEKPLWTQVLFGKRYRMQNPLRQTYRQKKVLAEFLQIKESYINTIVYFNGDCSFKTEFPKNVINYGLIKYIKSFSNRILSPNEIKKINRILSDHKISSTLTRRDHVHSLAQRHGSNSNCPKCGGELVLRTAQKGQNQGKQFLGCISFPKCKFSKSA